MTEGRNTRFIGRALEIFGITGVQIIGGVEGKSGDTQLRTLFEFLSKLPHKSRVIFVWDCDVSYRHLTEKNNTIPFVFAKNDANAIAERGIENLFHEELFDRRFCQEIHRPNRGIKKSFDGATKVDFEKHTLSRNNSDDFEKFKPLITCIREILARD